MRVSIVVQVIFDQFDEDESGSISMEACPKLPKLNTPGTAQAQCRTGAAANDPLSWLHANSIDGGGLESLGRLEMAEGLKHFT